MNSKEKDFSAKVPFRLIDIHILKFNYTWLLFEKNDEIKYSITSRIEYYKDQNNLAFRTYILCNVPDTDDPNKIHTYIEFEARFIFNFKELKSLINDDKMIIPKELLIALTSLSISTARGIIFEKLSSFHQLPIHRILPLVDPKSAMPPNIIDLKK